LTVAKEVKKKRNILKQGNLQICNEQTLHKHLSWSACLCEPYTDFQIHKHLQSQIMWLIKLLQLVIDGQYMHVWLNPSSQPVPQCQSTLDGGIHQARSPGDTISLTSMFGRLPHSLVPWISPLWL